MAQKVWSFSNIHRFKLISRIKFKNFLRWLYKYDVLNKFQTFPIEFISKELIKVNM